MNRLRRQFHSKRLMGFFVVSVVAAAGAAVIYSSSAAAPFLALETEQGARSGSVSAKTDSTASAGSAVQFGPEITTEMQLPPPIDPGDRDFGRIVRQTAPNGGIIVLPDGDYRVSDVLDFNPPNFVVVVAQNPLQARVVRTANTVGSTDQYFARSSKLIFVGIHFKDIVTAASSASDMYFWHTKHTYPITAHPDPTQTYCGGRTSPDGVELSSTNRVGLFGSVIDGAGHDAVKLNNADNLTLRGVKITNVDHGGLQDGRGNTRCGWDGNDNYHDDGIQIYPGGVDNLLVENSYIGRHGMLQVDSGGASNNNLVLRNNVFYEEPPKSSCLAIDARVKTTAAAGAVQTMTMQNNTAWCKDSQWVFHVAGSRDKAMVVNGEPIPSTAREANRFFIRKTGTPDRTNTPSEAWKAANPYPTWPCYLAANVPGFVQSVEACGN